MNSELFWNATNENLKRGYTHIDEDSYTCLLCGHIFEEGVIYQTENGLYDAKKMAEVHIKTHHPPIFEYLMSLGRVYTGLSPGQEELARLFAAGHSDKEIMAKTGANSPSTIRNQRFAIREKYKQAKILVALVELMEDEAAKRKKGPKPDDSKLVDFHPQATSIDDRFAITQAERDEVLARYFSPDGKLLIEGFPAKEKRKIIIMQKLIGDFQAGRHYAENEVNRLLKKYYEDYVSVRRCMIEYGFLDRNGDGTQYWIKT
ncbi:MAG: DUF2087 domain-containing protein [Defluviitaleaceae bacterium]|nr:DUF2087 domain-containing protein [Defluviitaleaceae bacterium]